jgi:hypothetical protein
VQILHKQLRFLPANLSMWRLYQSALRAHEIQRKAPRLTLSDCASDTVMAIWLGRKTE